MKNKLTSRLLGKVSISNSVLFTTILTFFVFSLVVVVMFIRIYQGDMKDSAITMSYQAVVQTENMLNDYVDEIYEVMNSITEKYYDEDIKQYIDSLIKTRPNIAVISVYDDSGNMIDCFSNKYTVKDNITTNLSYPLNCQKTFKPQISDPHVVSILNEYYPWVVSVCDYAKDINDKEYIIVIDVLFYKIINCLDEVSIGEHGYCYIKDSEDNLIYHPQQQLVYSGNQIDIPNYDEGVYIDKEAIYTVKNLEECDWQVVGVSYVDEMINEKVEYVLKRLIIIALIVLVAVVLISYAIVGMFTDPIKKLTKAMKKFEKDAENFEFKSEKGTYEIKLLSDSFEHMVYRIQGLMKKVRQEEITLRKTELKALQAQINPHFLYNTLDAIAWMCEEGNSGDAEVMVTSLARLFRISISRGHELIPIEKEIQHAESYLKIEKYRYKDHFTYSFDVQESCVKYLCNKITLQPFIENAIYHGVNQMVDQGEINIKIYEEGGDVIFKISDNGVGMTEEQCEEILSRKKEGNNGIGIINVDDRIKIYFGDEYGLSIFSEVDEGTVVTIRLPKVLQEDGYEK